MAAWPIAHGGLGAVEGDVAERAGGGELGAGGAGLDPGAGGQLDGDLTSAGAAEDPVGGRGGDAQGAVAVGGGGRAASLTSRALAGSAGRI